MTFEISGQILWFLAPEIALLATALLILGLDGIRPCRERQRCPLYVALGGFGLALGATLSLRGYIGRPLPALSSDPFALTTKIIALGGMGIVALLSDDYIQMHSPEKRAAFYALLLFSSLSISLMTGASDLILILLALECLSVTSYFLTGYLRDDPRAAEAALKYFMYGAAMSAMMLYGASWFYGLTGSTGLREIAAALIAAEDTLRPALLPALIFVIAGLAYKIAAVPFHQWAPDAYEGAPPPVAAYLSVGPVVGGFAVTMRLLLTALPVDLADLALDWRTLLIAISALTMTVGNLVALRQRNIKRLLAYSSIAQVGYLLVGLVVASPRGVTAALFYLVAYALSNLGAFAVVITFANQTGSGEIADYAGLSARAPLLAIGLTICLFSLAGLPVTAGFVGKWRLLFAAIEQGLLWLSIIGALNSAIALAGYWRVIRAVYLTPAQVEEPVSASPTLAIALGMTVAGVLLIGVMPGPLMALVQAAAPVFFGR